MSMIDDDENEGCSFIWKIDNLTYFWDRHELESPRFVLDQSLCNNWSLCMTPRLKDYENGSITVGLRRYPLYQPSQVGNHEVKAEFSLSILTANGSYKKTQNSLFTFVTPPERVLRLNRNWFQVYLLKCQQLLEKGSSAFLNNDTITLRCRIWKINDTLVPTGECHARTIIPVERNTILWSLAEYLQERKQYVPDTAGSQAILPYCRTLDIKFIKSRGNLFAVDCIKLEIKPNNSETQSFATCKISLLEADGKIVHNVRDEYLFEKCSSNVWKPPFISMSKIVNPRDMFIRCELAASTGALYSYIERCESKPANHPDQLFTYEQENDSNYSDTLQENLQRFYMDGKFTDLTIRTQTKEFPVHKMILCARSEVFYTIFQHDMEENRSGVIEIIDIDAETIHRMLTFVYSDKVEDLDCDSALKLYYASDKYRITALKSECSEFFKYNMNVCDACDVLVLANNHQDEHLKLFVQEYIIKTNPAVMDSEKWKMLSMELPKLTSEVVQAFFNRNI